ncbi:MAG: Protein of unknown function (DUF1616) [Methanobacterium sp. Maddingley MBC34]|nr:MAG: Protein of unknown function (DUF1616) [Methanobacterium sp. Maddingley MBC34]
MNVDRTLSIIIVIFLIIGLLGIFYIILTPNETEKYTEFYLLGQNGNAGDYPTNLTTGESGNLTVGVVNQEHSTSSYQMMIIGNNKTLKTENFTLMNGQKKEIPFEFTAEYSGQYKLEFNLYKLPDNITVYRSLFLLVNVTN